MIQINSMKGMTKNSGIISLEEPDLLLVPLFDKFGSKTEACVAPGDKVKKYQTIGRSVQGFSVPAHSPVSGVVEKIDIAEQIDGSQSLTVFIRNDKLDTEIENPLGTIDPDSPENIMKLIEEAGIVGMGGAQFPAAVKYNRKEKKVNTLIVNGAECEPYLTADYTLMKNYPLEILEGIDLVDKVLDADQIVIAFEKSNRELEKLFNQYLKFSKYQKIRLRILSDEYPQGGELQLIRTVTGIEMAKGTLPLDQGVIVSNVGTVYAVYNAVMNRRPLTEKIITVSGEKAGNPGNYRIKIGTQVSHIARVCAIDPADTLLISGGPMMSPHITNLSVPMHKGALGVLALPKKNVNRLNCIWCGYCADVCPMRLMPMKFDEFFRQGKYSGLEKYDIGDCIECGACEFICPSKVPLIESIKRGKFKVKESKNVSR